LKDTFSSTIEDEVLRRAKKLGACEVEVLGYSIDDSVARFSKNVISESIAYRYLGMFIRILTAPFQYAETFVSWPPAFDGEADRAKERMDSILKVLIANARAADRKEAIKSFNAKRSSHKTIGVYSKKTAETSDKERAEQAGGVIDKCLNYDQRIKQVAGTITTRAAFTSITNSNGLRLKHEYTGASFVVTPLAEESGSVGIGFTSCSSHEIRGIDFDGLAEDAARDSVSSLHPKPIALGKYNVIFAPDSAGDVVGTFVQLGFWVGSPPAYVKLGVKCASEILNVTDDANSSKTLMACSFDAEGNPTKRLNLIKSGIATSKCFDRRTSFAYNENLSKKTTGMSKAGRKKVTKRITSTGHSMFLHDGTYNTKFFSGWSYYPQNQIVKPGTTSVEEMISNSKSAVLIKRLMYAGLPMGISAEDTIQAYSMGTWMIEDGKITHALPSLRISDSLGRMVKAIDMMGNARSVKRLGSINMPWMRCRDVNLADSASLAIPEGAL
jgi:PmbA protein